LLLSRGCAPGFVFAFGRRGASLHRAKVEEASHIEEHDQTPLVLAQTSYTIQSTLLQGRRRRLYVRDRNLQHFGSRIHDQPGKLAMVFHDEDPISLAGSDFLLAQALAQVEHRDNLSAKIDDPFHE